MTFQFPPLTIVGDYSGAVFHEGDRQKVVVCATFIGSEFCVMLQRHPKKAQAEGSWTFPSGKVEIGETEIEAAFRELEEEVGITDVMMIDRLHEKTIVSSDGSETDIVYYYVRAGHTLGKTLGQLIENREPEKHAKAEVLSTVSIYEMMKSGIQFDSHILAFLGKSYDFSKAVDRDNMEGRRAAFG